jgi:hypothetical protein
MASHATLVTGFLLLMALLSASVHAASIDVDREFDDLKKLLKILETNLESVKTKVINKVGKDVQNNHSGCKFGGERSV